MKNFIQKGDHLDLTAPAGGVVSGQGYTIGKLVVVAIADADAGDTFAALNEGVVELDKAAADTINEGDLVYWDDTAKEITTTAGANEVAGHAVEDKAASTTKVKLKLKSGTA